MEAAEHLIWVLDQQATIEAAASAADDGSHPDLHSLIRLTEAWIDYFLILRCNTGSMIWVPQYGPDAQEKMRHVCSSGCIGLVGRSV